MTGLSHLKPGSMKGQILEITNSKNPENEYVLDFSKSEKELLNDLRLAINSGAENVKLNVIIDTEANLFKYAVNNLKEERITPLKGIAQENSQIVDKLKTIQPVFGNLIELEVLDVGRNQAISSWKDIDKLRSTTEKQYLETFESRLKQAWEKGQINQKGLIALSGNHQNASLITGQKIDRLQEVNGPAVLNKQPKQETPKKANLIEALTPSQLEAERKKVFSIIEGMKVGRDLKVLKPQPGTHEGFIVGVTDHFVVQRLGAESSFFMVHNKADLPTAKVDFKERVRVHRNDQGQSNLKLLTHDQAQDKSTMLKR